MGLGKAHKRIRYKLYGQPFGVVEILAPRGWKDDKKELSRDPKYHGVTPLVSNNLEFYGKGFESLKSAYDIFGIKANIRLEREDRDDDTDEWDLSYVSYPDYSTYKQSKNFVKMKFNESKFFKNIESRFREKYEIDRTTDLDGNYLPPLQYANFDFKGRDIFRETLFENKYAPGYIPGEDATIMPVRINYKGSGTFDAAVDISVPFTLNYRSDESFFAPAVSIDTSGYLNLLTARIPRLLGAGDHVLYNGGTAYYLSAEKDKTIHLKVNMTFKAKYSTPGSASATLKVYHDLIRTDEDGNMESFDETELIIVSSTNVSPAPTIIENQWATFSFEYEENIDLLKGDSMGLRFQPTFGGPYLQANQWQIEMTSVRVLAQENDLGDVTNCKALTLNQVCQRLFWIVTGKNSFSSDLLTGYWKDLLFTNGFNIRQMPDKPITVSLQQVWELLNTIDDVAMLIQNEMVSFERKDKAYTNEISVDLGSVSNIEREIDASTHFSAIEIGYDIPVTYEEVNGLEEYNIKNTYATCIGNPENVHQAVSVVRADPYGMTLAQAKPYSNFPKTDTNYDKDNFVIDCKLVSGIYAQRFWADDFDTLPQGVFSPETAFNLRLSPANCLFRKGPYLSTGLQKFPTELIRYTSTEGNSNLVTDYPERLQIANSLLDIPYFLPEKIKFNKQISMQVFRKIVLNPYKMIKFVNEYGKAEYGYIYPSVKPNNEGDFELIKANV